MFTLVPSAFFSPESASAALAQVGVLSEGSEVKYTAIPQYGAVLVYSGEGSTAFCGAEAEAEAAAASPDSSRAGSLEGTSCAEAEAEAAAASPDSSAKAGSSACASERIEACGAGFVEAASPDSSRAGSLEGTSCAEAEAEAKAAASSPDSSAEAGSSACACPMAAMLERLSRCSDYNKILCCLRGDYLYLAIAQGKTLLLANSYRASDFTTAEYFIFLAVKSLQINPEVSTIYFISPLSGEEEMSLYHYFKSVVQL